MGEPADISTSLGLVVTFNIPQGPPVGDDPVAYSSSGVIRVQTLQDLDAEDDNFTLSFSMTAGGLVDEDDDAIDLDGDQPTKLSIEDDEDQEYNLTTDDDDAKEGDGTIMATVTANPAHVDGSADLSVQLDASRSVASITTPATATVPTLNSGNRSENITITLGGNDKNRDEGDDSRHRGRRSTWHDADTRPDPLRSYVDARDVASIEAGQSTS